MKDTPDYIKKSCVLWLVAIFPALTGCQDAKWQAANEERQDRIKKITSEYAAHDANGMERIKHTIEVSRDLDVWRAECRDRMSGVIRESWDHDIRRWRDDAPKREAMLRDEWNGEPDRIPRTWARMVY